ncbi:hypothetical protein ABTY59_31975 [Streptomyces sp. NPDC096079]|uniref:hypothetical protein n=1 Tax=Streptomyces sp. NPDC096079 TaxID=3155820 RepID=UPI003316FBE5
MSQPSWLAGHLPAGSPFEAFVVFTDAVSALLDLPSARPGEVYVRRYDTGRVWLTWRLKNDGATLFLERPHAELREGLTVTVQWHLSPSPETVAAMVRAYERGARHEQRRRPCRLVRWWRGL